MTNTWVDSFEILLNAYQEIGERLPSFVQYQALFDSNPDMRRALELYFCDILEFHHHALKFLNKAGRSFIALRTTYSGFGFTNSAKVGDDSFDPLGRHLRRISGVS